MAVLQCAFGRARERNGRGMRRGSAARAWTLLKTAEARGEGDSWERGAARVVVACVRREQLGKEKKLTDGPRMSAAGERERRGEGMLAGWLGQAGEKGGGEERRVDFFFLFLTHVQKYLQFEF